MVGVDLAYSRCGFVVGALAGCTGTGGGALIEPLLIPLFLIGDMNWRSGIASYRSHA